MLIWGLGWVGVVCLICLLVETKVVLYFQVCLFLGEVSLFKVLTFVSPVDLG